MSLPRLVFRVHALRRMFERNISADDVQAVLAAGVKIEDYPEDAPVPSALWLGWIGTRPIHVVAAKDSRDGAFVIITVYEPDAELWDLGFTTRRNNP